MLIEYAFCLSINYVYINFEGKKNKKISGVTSNRLHGKNNDAPTSPTLYKPTARHSDNKILFTYVDLV